MTSRLPVVALDALPQDLPDDAKLYVKPLPAVLASNGLASANPTIDHQRRLAVTGPSCDRVDVLIRLADHVAVCRATIEAIDAWCRGLSDAQGLRITRHLGRALKQPEPFAGLDTRHPHIMGIINVTPDSFSDGGDAFDVDEARAQGRAQAEHGAAILDIGGESTRPGADPVPVDEEIGRVEPVVRALAGDDVLLSIDTRHAEVMAAALDAGADIVNDVSALTHDPAALDLVAERAVPVVLMHAQGDPRTMQKAPAYDHVSLDVYDYLEDRIETCLAGGMARKNICIDPGIGFGKTLAHNLTLMRDLALFHGLGCPILLGASRKSLIARIAGDALPKQRLAGSLALALAGIRAGVQILRVHDVAETDQAIRVWQAVEGMSGEV